MDVVQIDQEYAKLQAEGDQTVNAVAALAAKLQAAADSGDANAREWLLDLKEVAVEIGDERNQTTALLQSIHALVAQETQAPAPTYQQPAYQQPVYQQPQQPVYQQSGGLGGFLGGGFGRAIAQGAGFGLGADIIQSIFR